MAYDFPDSGDNRISISSGIASALPLTFSWWVQLKNHTDGKSHGGVCLARVGAGFGDYYFGFVSSAGVVTAVAAAGGSSSAATAGTISDENPHHCLTEFATTTSRTAALDGSAGSPETTSRVPTMTSLQTSVGCFFGSAGAVFNGQNHVIWGVGVWNTTLSSPEKVALAAGESPLKIARANLIWAPDLISTPWDPITAANLTVSGAGLAATPSGLRLPRVRGGLIRPGGIRLAA